MQRPLYSVEFCNWCNNPWCAPSASQSLRSPGDCYTGSTQTWLFDQGDVLLRPGAIVWDSGVANANPPAADGSPYVGPVLIELFALSANDWVPAGNPSVVPSFKSVCQITTEARSNGPNNVWHALTAAELDTLMGVAAIAQCGLTVGTRIASGDGVTIPKLHFSRLIVRK